MARKIIADVVGVLRDKRNRHFPLQHAILELLDNSVDAGATEIAIRESDGDLTIVDNGSGFEKLPEAVDIGESNKRESIGRYGVGLKDAALRFSDETIIESRGQRIAINWKAIVDGDVPAEVDDPEPSDIDSGARIEFIGFRNRYKGGQIQTVELRRAYWPLVLEGKLRIEINGNILPPLELPTYTEKLEAMIDFDGKRARLTGGLFAPNDPRRKEWCGYHPFYRGRLMGDGRITQRGVGDEACSNFCFLVMLEDAEEQWKLSTNKDYVEDLDELLDYIYHAHTAPLLKKGAQQSEQIELKEIEDAVNASQNGEGGNITRKPKTNQGEGGDKGKSHKPGPRKQRTNTADEPGAYQRDTKGRFLGNGNAHFLFKFAKLDGIDLGEIQEQKKLLITANLSNSFIADNSRNEEAMTAIAKLVWATFKHLRKTDTCVENLINGILETAGYEIDGTA